MFVCDRAPFIPTLGIRPAEVEDHDDLVPVFDAQSEVVSSVFGDFFLAEAIEAQSETRKALVGCEGGAAVGLMALSSEVDLGLLDQCFELASFQGLTKRTAADDELAALSQRRDARVLKDWLGVLTQHADEWPALFGRAVEQSDH